jgi:DNA-binding NarL/FixJ family response regulator
MQPTAADPPTRKVRIVIADDDEATRSLLRQLLLEVDGVEFVGEAVDGIDAVKVALSKNADVVLLDVTMARMDGLEAAAEIARWRPGAQLIVHTGEPDADKARRAEELGVKLLIKNAYNDSLEAVRACVARVLQTETAGDGESLGATAR